MDKNERKESEEQGNMSSIYNHFAFVTGQNKGKTKNRKISEDVPQQKTVSRGISIRYQHKKGEALECVLS